MISKLERARLVLKEHELQGMQAFNCETLCEDFRETVYEDEEISIKVSYYWEYVEILGLSDSEFEKLIKHDGRLRTIKWEI